jgi:hypothetical protein
MNPDKDETASAVITPSLSLKIPAGGERSSATRSKAALNPFIRAIRG